MHRTVEASCNTCLAVNKVELPKMNYRHINIQCYKCGKKFPWQIKKRISRIIAVDENFLEAFDSEDDIKSSSLPEVPERASNPPKNLNKRTHKNKPSISAESFASSELSELSKFDRANSVYSMRSLWSQKSRNFQVNDQMNELPEARRLSRIEVTERCTYCSANNLVEIPTRCKSVTVECCICRSHFQVKPPTSPNFKVPPLRTTDGPDPLKVSS
eukprot:UN29947